MKKLFLFVASLCLPIAILLSLAPIAGAVNSNNFSIGSYKIDYYLGQDSDSRSTLKTVETIQAQFPSANQNHGIERAIPTQYDGHGTSLKILSVTNGNGKDVQYSTSLTNGNEVVRIGDADTYVHGSQTYVLTYTQRDVTRYFGDTSSDEFYWDTNGTEWKVPIRQLDVKVHVEGDLASKLNGKQSCYRGVAGEDSACVIATNNGELTASVGALTSGQNMTIAVGFAPQTFNAYVASPATILFGFWVMFFVATFFVAIVALIVIVRRFKRQSNRTGEVGTIVPEYVPPKDASVTVSGSIYNKQSTVFSAQLIDFAVRHYTKIYQISEKSLLKSAKYEIEIVKEIATLRDEEQEIIRDIFSATIVGTRLNLDEMQKDSTKTYVNMSDNQKKLDTNIRGLYELRFKDVEKRAKFKRTAVMWLVLALLTMSPWLLIVSIVAFVYSVTLWPLTDKGLALYRYLEGLKMYIGVAEVERLKMLQSPDGAAKLDVSLDATDTRQLVRLYERVLPYAVLFGQEKEWNKRLGQYYESMNASPDWYVGSNAVFNAAVFSAAISSFDSAATYSSPTSSASGGSGGGGFSGGGGGGGGGGGW